MFETTSGCSEILIFKSSSVMQYIEGLHHRKLDVKEVASHTSLRVASWRLHICTALKTCQSGSAHAVISEIEIKMVLQSA